MTKTLQEISDETRVSLRTLNKLAKSGYLNFSAGTRPESDQMTYYLRKGKTLPAELLLKLYQDSGLAGALAAYESLARQQLRALGDIAADALPADRAAALIFGAAVADKHALPELAEWARSVIPARGCGYHYLAVRLLYNVPADSFAASYKFAPRAILNMRQMPSLIGWHTKEKTGMRFRPPHFDI